MTRELREEINRLANNQRDGKRSGKQKESKGSKKRSEESRNASGENIIAWDRASGLQASGRGRVERANTRYQLRRPQKVFRTNMSP
jgi:hypothetical protein